MTYVKLDEERQHVADITYSNEEAIIKFMDDMESAWGKSRWLSIARTNIELGFMSIRRAITVAHKFSDRASDSNEDKGEAV